MPQNDIPGIYYRTLYKNGNDNFTNGWIPIKSLAPFINHNIVVDKYNILNNGFKIMNMYNQYNSGIFYSHDRYVLFYMIPVLPGDKYYSPNKLDNIHISFYDEYMKFVSGILVNNANTTLLTGLFTVPENCYYMSCSMDYINNPNLSIVSLNYYYDESLEDEDKIKYNLRYKSKSASRNLIDNNIGIKNKFYNYQDGNMSSIDYYNAIQIPAIANKTYYFKSKYGAAYHVAFMDAEGNYISGDHDKASFTTPENCYYMNLGFRYADDTIEEYNPVLSFDPNPTYSKFACGDVYTSNASIPNTLTVGAGMQYETIADAISAAKDDDTILIYPGIYNETTNAYSKRLHFKGVSKAHCIWTHSANDYDYPPLHMAKGSMENLTIHATWNGDTSLLRGYCVHIDNNNETDETLLFNNVDFISERGATVGIGMRGGFTLRFENCTFRATETALEGPVYNHTFESGKDDDTGSDIFKNQKVEYINCTIINETRVTANNAAAILLQSQEKLDKCCEIKFINNTIIQPNTTAPKIHMILWRDRRLTNTNYLGSSDFVLSNLSYGNNIDELNYSS